MNITKNWSMLAPKGARVRTLTIDVDQDAEWNQAIDAAAPGTNRERHVRQAGHLFPPAGRGMLTKQLVMLNFQTGHHGWDQALYWSSRVNLNLTFARDVFATSKQVPDLGNYIQGMRLVATTHAFYEVGDEKGNCTCSVSWLNGMRQAGLPYTSICCGPGCWYLFSE